MDRKAHWEHIYQDKLPINVSWYQAEPELSLALIRGTGVASAAPIIDVGGGASVLVDRLLAAGFEKLAVLDISAAAIQHARTRLGKLANRVTWYEADVTAFAPPHAFELWHDRAVFHFLTDREDRKRYVRALKEAVVPDGHVIIAAFAIGGPKKCSGLEIVQYDAARLCDELGGEFELLETRDEMHITPAHAEQKFSFFRFIRKSF